MNTSGLATTNVVVLATKYGDGRSGFPDIVMKNFALRIFYILDANECQNQVPLGCTTIHAIFLLTVRRIRMFFSLKPFLSQGESSLKISARWGSLFRRS